jgi:prevent-host-death family protein
MSLSRSIQSIGLFEAKTHFSELVSRAEAGEEIVITRHNKPVVRLVAVQAVPVIDKARRLAAIQAIIDLNEDIRRDGGAAPIPDIVQLVRDQREEQTARKLKAAGIE